MTKQNESGAKSEDIQAMADALEARQRLVASVAGSVAAGIVMSPSKLTSTSSAVAEVAVDIAEEIVKKVGL